jgi:hypothetical protein
LLTAHQDARLTLGRYAYVEDAALRAAVERLPSIAPAPLRPTKVIVEIVANETRAAESCA